MEQHKLIIFIKESEPLVFIDDNLDHIVSLYGVVKDAMATKKEFIEIAHSAELHLIPVKEIAHIKTVKNISSGDLLW